jgi:hypothetical protein
VKVQSAKRQVIDSKRDSVLNSVWVIRFHVTIVYIFRDLISLQLYRMQAKELIQGPSAKRTKDLLRLNRDQLRWVVGLLTGHCHLKGHLFKLGLTADPIYERCLEDDESSIHIFVIVRGLPTQDSVTWVNTLWNQVITMMPPIDKSPTLHSKCGINQS